MTANDTSIDARDWSLLGLLSVLWGGSFFFNGVVLKELPPLTVVFLRVALAALMLLPMLWLYRRCPASSRRWRHLGPDLNVLIVSTLMSQMLRRSSDGCRRRPCR